MLPYTINSNITTKKRSMQDENFIEEENDEEEDDSIESDKMIKVALKIISTILLRDTNFIKKVRLCNLKIYYRQRNLLLLVLVKALYRRKEVANRLKNVERDAINLNKEHIIISKNGRKFYLEKNVKQD